MKNIKTLKQKRLKLKLTQFELALRAGLNQSRYSKIENGLIKPSPSELKRILNSLKKEI